MSHPHCKQIGEGRPDAGCPRPDEIRRLAKAFRLRWSDRERRERAGLARELQSALRQGIHFKRDPDGAAR